jgi:large subunit ribosomal protein L18
MAISKSVLKFRRRRDGKTDYKRRLGLLKSGLPRLVIRSSLRDVTVQIIEYSYKSGDSILASSNSKSLKKQGWKLPCGNLPSAYLIGLLCGKLVEGKVKKVILDSGKGKLTKGNLIYAAMKGFADSGIKIPFSDDKLPSEERISGKHIEDYAKKLQSENPDKYKSYFGNYLKANLKPEEFTKTFEEVKKKISS